MTLLRESVLPPVDPEDYRTALYKLLFSAGQLTNEAELAVVRTLDSARKEVLSTLGALAIDSPSRALYDRTLNGIDGTINKLRADLGLQLDKYQGQGFLQGVNTSLLPVAGSTSGLAIGAFSISTEQLTILSSYSADLVQGLTLDLRKKINTEISAVMVGAKTPQAAASQIGKSLTDRNHFKTTELRARAIVVTEVGRAQALGAQAAQDQLRKDVMSIGGNPDSIRKRWINAHLPGARQTHLEAEARYRPDGDPGPIPVNAMYEVGGFKALYPRDPSLPASESVFCHCVSVTIIDDGSMDALKDPIYVQQAASAHTAGLEGKVGPKDPQWYTDALDKKAKSGMGPVEFIPAKPVPSPAAVIAAAKPKPAPKPKAPPKPKIKLVDFYKNPYAHTGLQPSTLANGQVGFGGNFMAKALGYTDDVSNVKSFKLENGVWKHINAPAGHQLPNVGGLLPDELTALLFKAPMTAAQKNSVLAKITAQGPYGKLKKWPFPASPKLVTKPSPSAAPKVKTATTMGSSSSAAPRVAAPTSAEAQAIRATIAKGEFPDSDIARRHETFTAHVEPKMTSTFRSTTWLDAEKNAVRSYTGSGFSSINGALRGQQSLSSSLEGMRKNLNRALDKYADNWGNEWVMTWRSTSTDWSKLEGTMTPGSTWTAKGYLSTSTLPGRISDYGTSFEILSRRCAWVKPISHYASENEWLIKEGTQFEVVAVRMVKSQDGRMRRVVQLRELPEGS